MNPAEVPLFIDGRPVITDRWIERENPASPSSLVGSAAEADAATTAEAIEVADAAFSEWASRSVAERSALLHSAADALRDDADATGRLLAEELGKPLAGSVGETRFSAMYLDQAADDAERLQADTVIENRFGRSIVAKRPYGVVSAIVPWNAPLILAMLKVGPALATGNTMVLKPSPLAPLALTDALGRIAAVLPPGVLNVVNGGIDAGQVLTTHPAVRKIAFTGGLSTARAVMASAANGVKPLVLELGGNDPAIVLDVDTLSDADIETMIAATYATSGQVCIAIKRIYVPDHQLDDFVARFVETARSSVRMGDPLNPNTTVGPVVSAAQKGFVDSLVDEARGDGASVVDVGTVEDGLDPAGYWVRPTVVSNASPESTLVATEQFGPTVPVLGYSTINDAVAQANDSDLGLAASVWGDDPESVENVARRLEVGTTFVNSHNRFGVNPGAPFGGTKLSGFGREYGDAGVEAYLQSHAINTPAVVDTGGYPTKEENADDG
ncbi:MAG: aldehyde dehydrogenase family protein [Acidimicrobiia bacterium]